MTDPVAAFLAREQGMFGELAGANEAEEQQPVIPDVAVEVAPPPPPNGLLNGNSDSGVDLGIFESAIPVVQNGRSISPSASERSVDEPVFQAKPDVEPESVKRWRQEYENNLKRLDGDEENQKVDLKARAKKELDDMYKQRVSDLENRKKENRKKQIEFLKNVEKASDGVLWQRIAKTVEEDEKTPKKPIDTDRMRGLLLQCKDGGPKPV